jgi:hypothetical protein
MLVPKNASLAQRWWEKVHLRDDGCWEWTASRDKNGYGRFQVPTPTGQKHIRAHRWGYGHFIGHVPDDLQVCHTCDRPWCVNPVHLWLGTNADNDTDKREKGRAPTVWGTPLKRRRQTHCKYGHEFTPENTWITIHGHRRCRECGRVKARAYYRRQKGQPQPAEEVIEGARSA